MGRINSVSRYVGMLYSLLLKPEINSVNPLHLQVEPTTACNMECMMCPRSKNQGQETSYLSYDIFRKLIDTIKPTKVNLTGNGESTLNNDLIPMIYMCRGKGIYVYLNTNLLVSKEVLERLVRSNIDLIKVSLDAATPDVYWQIRRNRSFDKILENLDYVIALRKATASNTSVRINTILMYENKDELCGILKIAKESGVDLVVVKQQCFYGNIEAGNAYCERFNSEPEVFEKAIRYGDDIGMENDIKELYDEFKLAARGVFDKEKCIMPWMSSYISANGNVVPCCYLANDSLALFEENTPVMGNIKRQSWKEIWNGDKYREMRRLLKRGEKPYPACKTCYPPSLKWMVLNLRNIAKALPGFLRIRGTS
jgi:radical SAM protein with 4Fe4S-binding SPASM domain